MFDKTLESMTSMTRVAVIYTNSPTFQLDIRQIIKKKYNAKNEFIVDVNKVKDLKNALTDSMSSPIFGDSWITHVDVDKIGVSESLKTLTKTTSYGRTIFWVSDFKTYLAFKKHNVFKEDSQEIVLIQATRLEYLEAHELLTQAMDTVEEEDKLSKQLIAYVSKNYRYKIESIYELITLVRNGFQIKKEKDVVKSIGVGFLTVDSFVIDMLKTVPETLKQRSNLQKKSITTLQELSYSYKHAQIKSYMVRTLKLLIEFKQMQLLGVFDRPVIQIPPGYDDKGYKKLKRYRWNIKNDITLSRILLLFKIITGDKSYDHEMSLLKGITEYTNSFTVLDKKSTRIKKGSKKKEDVKDKDEFFQLMNSKNEELMEEQREKYQEYLESTTVESKEEQKVEGSKGVFDLLYKIANQYEEELTEQIEEQERLEFERQEELKSRVEDKQDITKSKVYYFDKEERELQEYMSNVVVGEDLIIEKEQPQEVDEKEELKDTGSDYCKEHKEVEKAFNTNKGVVNPFENIFENRELQKKQAEYMAEKQEKEKKDKQDKLTSFVQDLKKQELNKR